METVTYDKEITPPHRTFSLMDSEPRIIKGGVGYNLPQEASQAFVKAVVEVDPYGADGMHSS